MIYEKSVVALQPDPATQGVCPTWHERAAVAAIRRTLKRTRFAQGGRSTGA